MLQVLPEVCHENMCHKQTMTQETGAMVIVGPS